MNQYEADHIRFFAGARIRLDVNDGVAPNNQPFDQMFIASSEALASDGGVIKVDGWRTKEFEKNPRFISNHNVMGWDFPITEIAGGSVVWLDKRNDLPTDLAPEGKGLVAAVRFAGTPFGQELKTLYVDGDLDAVSVRWDPWTEERRHPTEEEKERYGPDLSWVATRSDLLELSAVILGADPGAVALRRCRSKGIALPHLESFIRQIEEASRMPPVLVTGNDKATTGTTATTINDSTVATVHFDRSGTMSEKNTPVADATEEEQDVKDEVVAPKETRTEEPEVKKDDDVVVDDDALRQEAIVGALSAIRSQLDLWTQQGSKFSESFNDLSALLAGEEIDTEERTDPLSTKISLDTGNLEQLVIRIEVAAALVSAKLADALDTDSEDEDEASDDEDVVEFETLDELVAALNE